MQKSFRSMYRRRKTKGAKRQEAKRKNSSWQRTDSVLWQHLFHRPNDHQWRVMFIWWVTLHSIGLFFLQFHPEKNVVRSDIAISRKEILIVHWLFPTNRSTEILVNSRVISLFGNFWFDVVGSPQDIVNSIEKFFQIDFARMVSFVLEKRFLTLKLIQNNDCPIWKESHSMSECA
jgi:hypothetical protein